MISGFPTLSYVGRMIRYLNLLNGHTPEQGLAYLIPYNYARVAPDPERFQGPLANLARLRWYLSREPLPPNSTVAQILNQAQALAPGPGYLSPAAFNLQGDFRRALFQHPPSRIEIPATATAGHTGLKFALALDPTQWSHPGDGVWFGVLASGRLLFSRNLNPSQRESDRRWADQEIQFRGGGSVQLATLPGPSADYDWSGWGDVRWLEEPVLRGRFRLNLQQTGPFLVEAAPFGSRRGSGCTRIPGPFRWRGWSATGEECGMPRPAPRSS